MIIPPKLKQGNEVRIIAPAKSFKPNFTEEQKQLAEKRLGELGLIISYGKHLYEANEFETATIKHRIEDLHDAFADKNVKAILTVSGGSTSNQLLRYIDYELIKSNPKILCGLSDITSLANAINTKTDLITYSGPHFTVFGLQKQVGYTTEYFKKCFFDDTVIDIKSSKLYLNERQGTEELENEGPWIINKGIAEGRIVGGNMVTFNLLQGSEYMPNLSESIIFIEDNAKESIRAVENHIQALILQPNFYKVRGIVIGRFQRETGMSRGLLEKLISSKKELADMPIIANINFGHTAPMITFPIGGVAKLIVDNNVQLKILKH